MVTNVPAIYCPSVVESASEIVSADERTERLARNIFAFNSLAAATVVAFLALDLLPSHDKSFVAYLALFVSGLTCATLVMMMNSSGNSGASSYRRSTSLGRWRRSFGHVGIFWLLFFGLLCFVSGSACGLVALSTSSTDGVSKARPTAAAAQPALTGAAVGFWEEELTSAMLAGDQPRFLQSCHRLHDLQMRPKICNLNAARRQGS